MDKNENSIEEQVPLDEPEQENIIQDISEENIYEEAQANNSNAKPSLTPAQQIYKNRQVFNKSNLNSLSNGFNKVPNINKQKNNTEDNKTSNNNQINKSSNINNNISKLNEINNIANTIKNASEEGKNVATEVAKEKVKLELKKKIVGFIISNLPIILLIIGVIFLTILLTILIITLAGSYYAEEQNSYEYGCSTISMGSTSLERQEFIDKVASSSVKEIFRTNAGQIYDIAKNNNINPEMVIIRASVEGYSPGTNNNYWGLGCTNTGGKKACINYNSFTDGVLGYINNIKKYSTVEEMVSKYAYIGANWYNPGSSSKGGCYYFPYIRQYMSDERANQVENYCSASNKCSGTSCPSTISEDQDAYSKWQVQRMVEVRESIFNITADECEEEGSDIEIEDDGTLGSQVANYAVETFDSYSYSQDNRFSANYVDCSSLVYRTYSHFGYKFGGNSTASLEYIWCKNNNKLITESELKPGDLIFFNKGVHYNRSKSFGVGHVSIYVGNGKHFAAHSAKKPQPDQVSVTNYSKSSGSFFCRPYK